jgi:Flp pilus assembly protein TadD
MSALNALSVEALFEQGNRAMAEGDNALAEACFRTALQLAPDTAELHANLAFLLDAAGDVVQAEACYQRAIACNPDIAQIHLNLGSLLAEQKRLTEAEAAFTHAITLEPDAAGGWSNLGGLYSGTRRHAEAELCCRQALLRDPQHAKARFNLAGVLLRQGRWDEGWLCLEARDWYAPLQAHLDIPRWRGEPLAGKSILIGLEAGQGDMIQFARYAAVLKDRGAARVTLLCHASLKALFASLHGVDEVLAFDEAIPRTGWDCWTPAISIPLHCATRVDSIPASLPYLHAAPDRIVQWRAQLPAQGLRVGLVWKGNPKFENDADRSLHGLHVLAPLAQVAGVSFISLQKGRGEEEALNPQEGFDVLPLGPQLADFADTAAVVAQLDLVISVDTAVAHLAGALNKPVWLLLPHYKTDWRWLEERSDSPWYPGCMRLFRQSASESWAEVVDEVRVALEEWGSLGAGPSQAKTRHPRGAGSYTQ